ncbi:hypothetical protein ME763_32100 [Streptomyces murinus]|uniref:hypothetical protein n=1 Tax=Streptomyces murinus TaxID=33900 RepID=UPI000A1EA2C8|nr:hypothetical protein [Streptomyces murinus]WDO09933.1 hypothetical protein ME763_32100 [Streptomyces murinus]
MTYRPAPDVNRALHQLKRSQLPEPPRCPVCAHSVLRHATEGERPVCSAGQGLVSCRDCAESCTPAVAAIANLGRVLAYGVDRLVLIVDPGGTRDRTAVRAVPEPAWRAGRDFEAQMDRLVAQVRQTGKTAITAAMAERAVKAGEHVHVVGRDGIRCVNGDPACSLWSKGEVR